METLLSRLSPQW